MIELQNNRNIIRDMLVGRFATRVLTLITAVFLFTYLLTGILKLAILAIFAYMSLLGIEKHNSFNALRIEIRKKGL